MSDMLRRMSQCKPLPRVDTNAIELERVALESAEIALLETDAANNIESLVDVAESVNAQVTLISDGVETADGLEGLVNQTLTTYGEQGLDEQGGELLRISVECILRARGIDIPSSMIVPSFESGMTLKQYSSEVIDRKNNLVSRIFSWIYTALKALADAMKNFFAKINTNAKAVKDYAAKVKVKVDALKGSIKDPSGTINLGTSAIWLTDKNERLVSPSFQIVNTVARFEDFVTAWRNQWKGITSVSLPTSSVSAAALTKASDAIKSHASQSNKANAKVQIDFVVTHSLELKEGTGEFPLLGATVSIDPIVTAKDHLAKILTLEEMKDGINDAISAMTVLDKLNTEVTAIEKLTAQVASLSKGVNVKDEEAVNVTELRNAFKALSKACSLSSWGWTNTSPYYIKTIKACVGYIDACTHRYGTEG